MMALTRWEKELSSVGRVVCDERKRKKTKSRQFELLEKQSTRRSSRREGYQAHLSTRKLGVGRNVEDVLDKLRDRLSADPEEDVLSVLDDEESVSFQSLTREVHGLGKDDSVLADGTSLRRKERRGRGETRQLKKETTSRLAMIRERKRLTSSGMVWRA